MIADLEVLSRAGCFRSPAIAVPPSTCDKIYRKTCRETKLISKHEYQEKGKGEPFSARLFLPKRDFLLKRAIGRSLAGQPSAKREPELGAEPEPLQGRRFPPEASAAGRLAS